jgi:hypothetical protein
VLDVAAHDDRAPDAEYISVFHAFDDERFRVASLLPCLALRVRRRDQDEQRKAGERHLPDGAPQVEIEIIVRERLVHDFYFGDGLQRLGAASSNLTCAR